MGALQPSTMRNQSTPNARANAQVLRREMTDSERKLWGGLRSEQLGVKFRRDDMTKLFLASRRSGFYFLVEQEGTVAAGDAIEILSRDPQEVSVADIQRLYLAPSSHLDLLQKAMKVEALPESWKSWLEEKAHARRIPG